MIRRLIYAATLLLALASCAAEERPLAYVSLGDSLAVGVGASDPQQRGYTPLYRDALAEETGREVRLVALGISGETSASFIGSYPDKESSQLARAEQTLEKNPNAIVTLSVGGNDLLRAADGTHADREAAITRYGENLDLILTKLEDASNPAPRISVLALYNPAPGSPTDAWIGRLNAQIRTVARENGAAVAAGDEAFRGHEREYVHHDRHQWDIHPTDKGYAALARAFLEASPKSY